MTRSLLKRVTAVDIFTCTILTLAALICFFPFYTTIILSFGRMDAYLSQKVYIIPKAFTVENYELLFAGKTVRNAFFLSVFTTFTGTLFSMILTTAAAYGLSKKYVPGRNILLGIIVFTMFFSGGLIPFYLLAIKLHLVNNLLVYIVKGAIGTYYMIIMKNYFNTIPDSLEESAKIDGANDMYILLKIVLPVSAPIIATMSLFYAVDKWNDWYTPLIYISNTKLYNLQILLRKIVIDMTPGLSDGMREMMRRNKAPTFSLGVRMAIIIVTTLPILAVYPFLQKYFAKGIMIGSIKS